VRQEGAHDFAQAALSAIAGNCFSNRLTCRNPNSDFIIAGAFSHYQHNQRVGEGFPFPPHPLKIGVFS